MQNISKDREKYYIADFQYSHVLPRYYYEVKKLSKRSYGYYGKNNEELVDLYKTEKNLIKKNKIGEVISHKNLNFVLMVAKRYTTNIDLLPDVINVGNLGLIKAIDKYKKGNNSKFITCAVWWVRMEIVKFLNFDNKTICVNSGQRLTNKKVKKIEKEFIEEYDSLPPVNKIIEIYNELNGTKLDDNGIMGINTSSIDLPLTYDNDSYVLGDLLYDDTLNYTDKSIEKEDNKERVKYLLKKLTTKEKLILVKIYGLNGEEPMTEENIANEMELTEIRIGQIRKKALEKLKEITF